MKQFDLRIGIIAFTMASILCVASGTSCLGASPVREFDAWITAVDPAAGTVTVHHRATRYTVTLRTDSNTVYQRYRQAPGAEFPSDQLMRFWGSISADSASIIIQGIRRSANDDELQPAIIPTQNYIGGRLRREHERLFIEVGTRRVNATLSDESFEGYFEEPGAASDLQPGRHVHVRYAEEASGGHAHMLIVTTTLPPERRAPSPPSGSTPQEVQQTFREIHQLHERIAPQLALLMPVTMTVTPELVRVGEPVTLQMEVLADSTPNSTLEVLADVLARDASPQQDLSLNWQVAGQRHGRTVYRAEHTLPSTTTGNYCVTWKCDIGGDIPQYTRHYATIDDSYAVCLLLSTSHRTADPGSDAHRLRIPYEQWIGDPLCVSTVLAGEPEKWAGWSREYRQWGTTVNPHLFGPYWVNGKTTSPQANLQAESPELQKTILEGYRHMLPLLGFGPTDMVSAYTMDNSFCLAARETGYQTISSLCSGQNFMDGPMRINHFGMPDRPYFIDCSDFRQPGPGGPTGLVGIPQCQRNTFLTREFNCTYCLEPAWNEYYNEGGGRAEVDDVWMSRMYDFFDAMLQNRLSQATPYFFNVGLEFNGIAPGIAEGNRLLIEYAAAKAKSEPLVFSTGPAVSAYYRRHFQETPETTCYQHDYFGGLTKLDKFVGYPDTLEIEGPSFQALMRAPEILPIYQYDYRQPWDYPAWGNEDIPRNRWGYLYPGEHDPYAVVPKILDTRTLHVQRTESEREGALLVTVTVQSPLAQKNLVLALWDLNRTWRAGTGWWSVDGSSSRFVPVRAPFTGNLNGLLVCDVAEGQNQFVVKIETPPRPIVPSTLQIGKSIEGRVFQRDGQWMAYLWPTRPWEATLILHLAAEQHADVYVAPAGQRQALTSGENSVLIPAGKWMRLTGLSPQEIVVATDAHVD